MQLLGEAVIDLDGAADALVELSIRAVALVLGVTFTGAACRGNGCAGLLHGTRQPAQGTVEAPLPAPGDAQIAVVGDVSIAAGLVTGVVASLGTTGEAHALPDDLAVALPLVDAVEHGPVEVALAQAGDALQVVEALLDLGLAIDLAGGEADTGLDELVVGQGGGHPGVGDNAPVRLLVIGSTAPGEQQRCCDKE